MSWQAEQMKVLCLYCRPYVRLKEYEIAEENEVLLWKFSTTKKAKCDGQHCTKPGELGTYTWVCDVSPQTFWSSCQ